MITLLTDFGTADYFVPAVKGVILSLHPQAVIIDLTHEVPAQDIAYAAFTLGACYHDFPVGTIHVGVVDPGVGSARRAIIVEAGGQFFVGPDNGLFSYVYARERDVRVRHITRTEFFRQPVSATFHGRDVFAPVAARLALGLAPKEFGVEINNYVYDELPPPRINAAGQLQGRVIHIDRFGNCITNFTEAVTPARLLVNDVLVAQCGTHFAQAANKDEPFAYLGSAGYWEIALWCASAAARFGLQRGAAVLLEQR